MELSQYKFKVIINAECKDVFNSGELNTLKNKFEEFNLGDKKTFCCEISNEPTYKVITNRHRIPDEYNWNNSYKEEATPLDEFMSIDEIKTIDYLDYEGEFIHRIINQEKTWQAGDYEVANSKDLSFVVSKYLEYILENHSNNENVISELQQILEFSKLSENYSLDIWFFDGYHWQ